MAKIFLVDLENVGWNSLAELHNAGLIAEDKVYVFCGKNAPNCPYRVVEAITKSKAKVEIISVKVGTPNALDFQLVYFLGNISKDSDDEFFIVSQDKGYAVLETFVPPINIRLVNTIQMAFGETVPKKTRQFPKMSKAGINETREGIMQSINESKVLNYKNKDSVIGMIMKYMKRSNDIKEFENYLPKISNKKTYRQEILTICRKYF